MEKCSYCNTEIIDLKYFYCKFCPLKFCTINCLMNHISVHNNSNNEEALKRITTAKRKYSRRVSQKYIFITPGIFHENVREFSDKYSFENFSKVLDGFIPIELGSGAYGRVYLVSHNETKEEYALKVIEKKKLLNMYGNCDIIYNEVNIHSKLEHPNIIRLYNIKETDKEINIIMEYAKNGNLYQLISKNKSGFSEKEAFQYFIQVVNAVYFLHENQIIHRDIKPENLLIGDNNIIKLCDFGWARNLTLKNRSSFCGTVEYMAPEIIESENYDFSVDIWSLGILLYELLFGHSPFKDKTTHNTIVNIKLHDLKFDKEISEECKDLINKLLEVNKEKRINMKDILKHDFVKKNENLINFITPHKLFNNRPIFYNEKDNDMNIYNSNINNNINMNSNKSNNYLNINLNSNDNQISRNGNFPPKLIYSRSTTFSKFSRYSNNNINFTTSKKTNPDNSMKGKLNFVSSTSKNLKDNQYLAKINYSINNEKEKSKKEMGNLSFKKGKRYSFEEIKEYNEKIEEEKKSSNNNIPKINREFVLVDKKKHFKKDNNEILPTMDENLFINELMNICQRHTKENIVK